MEAASFKQRWTILGMSVATLLITILIPEAHSLKDKRAVVRSTIDRVRSRFNVAIAEVGLQDHHTRAELGIAAVSASPSQVQEVISRVARFIEELLERDGSAEVIDIACEIL